MDTSPICAPVIRYCEFGDLTNGIKVPGRPRSWIQGGGIGSAGDYCDLV
ncbi:MAG: hypothetical protein ACLVJO_04425 [[Clostridium] scindens]